MLRCTRWVLIALVAFGCGGDDGGSGDSSAMCFSAADCAAGELCVESVCVPDDVETCASDADCPSDRPTCQATATGGVCVAGCATDDDCASGTCIEGSCSDCLAGTGTVLPSDTCGCDADCAGTGAICAEGLCQADCEETGCPEGLACEGAPAECVSCETDTRGEGSSCECDGQCADALACIGGFCGEPCDFDETCGEGECGHEVLVPSSCRPADPACFGDGSGALGAECACNRDCAFDAPFCVGFFAGGERGFVCSEVCGGEDPCPEGYECCGRSGSRHCLSAELAEAAGATCD